MKHIRIKKSLVWFVIITALLFPFFWFGISLFNTGFSLTEVRSLNGVYRVDVVDSEKLTFESGDVLASGIISFWYGLPIKISFPGTADKVNKKILVSTDFLKMLSQKKNNELVAEKTFRSAVWKFWRWDKSMEIIRDSIKTKDVTSELDSFKMLDAESSDFIMLTFENQSDASDSVVQKILNYSVFLDGKKPGQAQLKITLLHDMSTKLPYEGLMRVAIPLESEVYKQDARRELTEPFRHVFEARIVLAPGESKKITYNYKLPLEITDGGAYALALVKTLGVHLNYEITVQTSLEYDLEDKISDKVAHELKYKNALNSDSSFLVALEPASSPLSLVKASFEGSQDIVLEFNRILDGDAAGDGLSYRVVDTNDIYPNVTGQVFVSKVVHSGRYVRLTLDGFGDQAGETYILEASGLRDINGLVSEQNPLNIKLHR